MGKVKDEKMCNRCDSELVREITPFAKIAYPFFFLLLTLTPLFLFPFFELSNLIAKRTYHFTVYGLYMLTVCLTGVWVCIIIYVLIPLSLYVEDRLYSPERYCPVCNPKNHSCRINHMNLDELRKCQTDRGNHSEHKSTKYIE